MKEKLDRPAFESRGTAHRTLLDYWDKTKQQVTGKEVESGVTGASSTIEDYLSQRSRAASRRKWSGRGLSLLGAMTLLSSCAVSLFSTTGLYSAGIGVALLISGLIVSSWKPRLKYTTEALIAAHKYGSVLNTTRLALEMDISPDKAEAVLQELVRTGIAEIELDRESKDGNFNYRIKGF